MVGMVVPWLGFFLESSWSNLNACVCVLPEPKIMNYFYDMLNKHLQKLSWFNQIRNGVLFDWQLKKASGGTQEVVLRITNRYQKLGCDYLVPVQPKLADVNVMAKSEILHQCDQQSYKYAVGDGEMQTKRSNGHEMI